MAEIKLSQTLLFEAQNPRPIYLYNNQSAPDIVC